MKLKGIEVDWAEDFNGAITVCNEVGTIVYMNQYSINQFKKYGGAELLGTNLLDCHTEPSKTKLVEMLENQTDNMYTTEKDNIKTIIFQSPWKLNGEFKGVIEISFRLDPDLPHFIRT
ncbi:MAG: diguanylate cyclase [Prolixibacteraceae bacterium]|jgi:transcriptional regulator with PAS, ATPase and Fis domain|nr:diguanylate cyclase [Prolixibacteraceae bacterium]MBT6005688.1 diguanylate cyclase [Prolixibacteraceae bacterium]MBT6763659.1 diguanylate cyclase [Prolixibacteraceae bacterium]MBT7000078.1 diguanylate cyclase [Prolixibacteraceae bacterium]MBT7395098.1 diguanylate cyclase [Prolixibacteraceae bacterium]